MFDSWLLVTLRGQTMHNDVIWLQLNWLNPFIPTSDQDRISPYIYIKQAGDENREEYLLWDY